MADPFDDILNLEDQFYDQGYKEGLKDGAEAGRIEGRSFGLEKGYEKFFAAGSLHGRAVVWANRLSRPRVPEGHEASPREDQLQHSLPQVPANAKLEKNIKAVYELLEPDTLPTENSDEAVADFDDRLKRAQTKAKLVQRAIGDRDGRQDEADESNANLKDASIEDIRIPSIPEGSVENARRDA